jgi:hypothetical protein
MDTPPLQAFSLPPRAIASSAFQAARGLANFKRALGRPAPGVKPVEAEREAELMEALALRLEGIAAHDATLQANAKTKPLPLYRSARHLIDACLLGLGHVKLVLDLGDPACIAPMGDGCYALAYALETGLELAIAHLEALPAAFQTLERESLAEQTLEGHDLIERAKGELSWRGRD